MTEPTHLRRAVREDADAIVAVIKDVVQETYGHLFSGPAPSPADAVIWVGSWVTVVDGRVAGVGRIDGALISDLWLRPDCRGRGVGRDLLALLEAQIKAAGHRQARLRVVAENGPALRFYARHGWQEAQRYPHERHGFPMVDMHKRLDDRTGDG